MAFDVNAFLTEAASCLEDGETGNIDQLCYCYAKATGNPCPPPESFGAGDRNTIYTAESFAQLALQGFGLDGTPAVPNPNGGPGPTPTPGPAPGPAPGQTSSPAPGPAMGQSFGLLVAAGFLFWFLLSD